MNGHLSVEKRRDLLEKKLHEDLQVENVLKLRINQEFEELKQLEVFLERLLERNHAAKHLSVEH